MSALFRICEDMGLVGEKLMGRWDIKHDQGKPVGSGWMYHAPKKADDDHYMTNRKLGIIRFNNEGKGPLSRLVKQGKVEDAIEYVKKNKSKG